MKSLLYIPILIVLTMASCRSVGTSEALESDKQKKFIGESNSLMNDIIHAEDSHQQDITIARFRNAYRESVDEHNLYIVFFKADGSPYYSDVNPAEELHYVLFYDSNYVFDHFLIFPKGIKLKEHLIRGYH